MSKAEFVLEIVGVHKRFGAMPALQGVDLVVRPGEFVALLGRNGAGKSTLLQMVTGLFAPDAGTIRVCGHDLRSALVLALATLGVVFQQQTLDLELSVAANLKFFAELQGLPRRLAAPRIAAALARHGLSDVAKQPVRTLSGGNRHRVELARALLHAPRVLIMDEATVGLDPASRQALLDEVRQLCREEGLAALWATHLVEEAEVADRVVVLEQGRIIFDDVPAALSSRHGGDLAQAFLALTGGD